MINKNVISFKAYYQVSTEKKFNEFFDNYTLFKYFFSKAEILNASITAMYGLDRDSNVESRDLIINYNEAYFHSISSFHDGHGLASLAEWGLYLNKLIFILYLILF